MYRWCVPLLLFALSAYALAAQDKPTETIPGLLNQLKQARVVSARARTMLLLADAYILKPGEEKRDMDSALLLMQEVDALNKGAADRELQGIRLILLSKLYRERGEQGTGKKMCNEALDWAQRYALPVQLAYANREMANYYTWEKPEELQSKIGYLHEAVRYFERTQRMAEAAQALELLGDCLSLQGNTEEALRVLHRSLERYKTSRTGDLQGVHILLGRLYLRVFDYQQALRYSMAAVRSMESRKDTTVYWINIYNEVGLSYSRLNDHEEAKRYFEKGLLLARRYKEVYPELLMRTNIAQTVALLGHPEESITRLKQLELELPDNDNVQANFYQTIGNVYITMGKLDSATHYLQKLQAMHSRLPALHHTNRQYWALVTRFHLEAGNFALLASNADSLRRFSLLMGDPVAWASSYYYRFKADSARGFWRSAILNHVRLTEIRDSLQLEKKNRELSRLKIEFQTEQKDADIRELQRQRETKDALLKQATLRQRLIVGSLAVLLVLLALLYSRYRIKRNSNRLLLQQKNTIDQKNASLELLNGNQQRLLEEKEWLLREIHHRVRNNLQIVLSLLNTQSVYLENDKAREAILQSQHRMYAMSLIHQRLYQAENVSVIEMEPYVLDMVRYLQDDVADRDSVRFVVSVEPVKLDVAQAVPVGLILNEAISNAVRHAFPGGRSGTIRVSLLKQDDGRLLLEVCDNGVGLPEGGEWAERHSMGLELIGVLTQQLNGTLTLEGSDGLRVRVWFTADEERRQWMNSGGGEVASVL